MAIPKGGETSAFTDIKLRLKAFFSILVLSCLLFLLFVNSIKGQIVYDNGFPNQGNAFGVTHWVELDDFAFTVPTRVEGVKFWAAEASNGFAGSVVWQIYTAGSDGLPGPVLYRGTSANLSITATGLSVQGYPEYVISFDIPPISLPVGVYWIGLHNGALSNDTPPGGDPFFWETTVNTNGKFSLSQSSPYTGPFFSNNVDLAFQLKGVALPRLTDFAITQSNPKISFTTDVDHTYRVDYKDSLIDSSWMLLPGAEAVPGTGDIVQVTDSNPLPLSSRSRFYRVGLSYNLAAVPTILTLGISVDGAQISFSTASGYYYRVEYKNNLQDTEWSVLPGYDLVTGTGDTLQVFDSDVNASTPVHRFYRVILF